MAGLNPVDDPARVHAVVVGIERYPRHPDWDLSGAVGDALRFAQWLRGGGVPDANVRLLLAPGEDSRRLLRTQAAQPAFDWCETWSRDQLMDAFTDGLDGRDGDLLYVYWGSHGVLGHGDRRLLLCPDASPRDKRCLDTAHLLEHLQRADLRGFGQQVLFFDTCATFLEHHHQPNGPAVAEFPTAPRRSVDQFLLYAAAAGQVAENDAAARSGAFSRAVLDWLETHAAGPRPDLDALATDVRRWFDEWNAVGGPRQTPVSLRIRTLDGSEERLVPSEPPPPRTPAVGRDEVALALRNALTDRDLRGRCVEHLASSCPGAALGPAPSDERIAEVLLTVERAMAAVVEMVHSRDREAADRLLALGRSRQAPGLLSPLEYAALREILGRNPVPLPTAHVLAAVRAALPMERTWLPPAVEDATGPTVGQLMACVKHFEEHTGGQSMARPGRQLVPAVVRFTELLAALAHDIRRPLHDWGERVARRLGVDPGGLAERRGEAMMWPGSLGGTPRVVAQLDPASPGGTSGGDGAGEEHFICVMWIDTGAGGLERATEQSMKPLTPRDVVRRIERTVSLLRALTEEEPVVEIVVPPDAVHLPVDSWDGSDDDDPLPLLLGVGQATVLRCAPLASRDGEERRRAALERRWSRRHNDIVVYLDDEHLKDRAAVYGALMAYAEAARVVVRAAPPGRDRLVQAALRLGYPVVLWDRQAAQAVPEAHFAPLRPEGAVADLPWRVRHYRAKACADPVAHPARPAVLLEAADRPPPPVLSLAEPSGLGEPAGGPPDSAGSSGSTDGFDGSDS
ncbi:hypothetical protein ACFY30_14965 [Streptomyces sp. NPDC000345]|uniref:VMAP-C domain-containing protein n=1 Tax=Streptomyces sp. NPDC000345 TaxID=3364537 RepID=UPI0036C64369